MKIRRRYTSFFANGDHKPMTTMREMRQEHYATMAFSLNGVHIGHGSLSRKGRTEVYTTGTRIDDKYRKQGHGIHLYHALIKTARELGATRIYSDTTLNKLSRKMWKTKLLKFYDVREIGGCKIACRHCSKGSRFYIIL